MLFKALVGSAGIRIVGMAFGFLVGVQLARGLGVEGYGIYGLAMSIISVISIPAEFGLPQLVTRETAKAQVNSDWPAIKALLGWAFRIVLLLSLVVLIVGGFVLWWMQQEIDPALLATLIIGFLFVIITPLANVLGAALRGLQHIVKGQVPEIILRPALFSAFLFAATYFAVDELNPALAIGLQVAAVACSALVAFVLLQRLLPAVQAGRISSADKTRWLGSAFPMAMTEAMRMVQGNLSMLVLGVMATTTMVGLYRVGMSINALMLFPVSLVHIVLAPVLARLHATHDKEKLQRVLSISSWLMVAGVGLLTLPFLFYGGALLELLFGGEFREANGILLLLSLGVLSGSIFGPCATLLNMTGHEKKVTRAFGISMLAQCVLTTPMISMMGGEGAAIANSIAFLVWSIWMWRDARRLLGVDASIVSVLKKASRNYSQ